jgi:hypothetical protein
MTRSKIHMNRVIFIVWVLFCAGCIGDTPEPDTMSTAEEYAVYSAVIESMFKNEEIAIVDHTSVQDYFGRRLRKDYQYFISALEGIEKETIDDFYTKNAKSYPLTNNFPMDAEVVFVSEEELEAALDDSLDWDEFYTQHPVSDGIVIFSRVGFNSDVTQALLYVGKIEGKTLGIGYYILVTKIDGQWQITRKSIIWVKFKPEE